MYFEDLKQTGLNADITITEEKQLKQSWKQTNSNRFVIKLHNSSSHTSKFNGKFSL